MKFLSWCGVFLLCGVSFAKPGFYPPSFPEIPDAVRKASNSVFRIVTYFEEIPIIPTELFPKHLAGLEKENSRFLLLLYKQVYKVCLDNKLDTCPIPYSGIGSAALVENNHTIFTVPHVFKSIEAKLDSVIEKSANHKDAREALARTFPSQHPEFVLYDNRGGCVFDTKDPSNTATVVYGMTEKSIPLAFPDDPGVAYVVKTNITPTDGILRIKLNNPLKGTPLRAKFREIAYWDEGYPRGSYGKSVYTLGFPAFGADKEDGSAPDSRGIIQYVTIGEIKKLYRFDEIEMSSAFKTLIERFTFATDCDSNLGMSGGAIVDASGEFITSIAGTTWKATKDGKRKLIPESRRDVGLHPRLILYLERFYNPIPG